MAQEDRSGDVHVSVVAAEGIPDGKGKGGSMLEQVRLLLKMTLNCGLYIYLNTYEYLFLVDMVRIL